MTNNVRAAILIAGATPLLYPTLAHKSPSGPLSPSSVTPESPSDPLSLRERVRVRAPHEPNQTEQSRTGSNARSHQKPHSNQPTPSKTNHPQPLCPRKTLGFRLFRPSKKYLQPPSTHGTRKRSRRRSNHALAAEPRRTEPNAAEQLRLSKRALRPTKLVQNCPKLTSRNRRSPAKHWRSCLSRLEEKILLPDTQSPQNPLLPNTDDQTEPRGVS